MSRDELTAHYASGYEKDRLARGKGRVEWLRTMEIVSRSLPAAPARILDVGGGAGAYALPLAKMGYETHLVDPVELHIQLASEASERQREAPLASAETGDARRLTQPDDWADAVLLLGPLYHLSEREARRGALIEACRVLRSGGTLLAAAISRFASTCDGLRQGFLRESEFERIVERDLTDGQHRNPAGRPGWFTTAYFHRPDELAAELESAELEVSEVLAVEGPAWLLGNLDAWLESEQGEQTLLRAIRRIEAEPSLLGASAHLLAVARKP